MPKDYLVVEEFGLDRLRGRVLECMAAGYQPLGGAVPDPSRSGWFIQTLVIDW